MKKKFLFFLLTCSASFLFSQTLTTCPSNSTPPSDLCSAACLYCDMDMIQSTSAGYTSQTPPGWCGSIENEQWLGFTAQCASVTFIATPSNCTDGNGLQIGVYESCSGNPIGCNGGAANQGAVPAVVTVATIPGRNYLLVIDGWAGDQCDFTITVVPPNCVGSQVDLVVNDPMISGPDTVCEGSIQTYTLDGVSNYNLLYCDGTPGTRVNGEFLPAQIFTGNDGSFQVQFPANGAANSTFSVVAGSVCSPDTTGLLQKTVVMLAAPRVILPDTTIQCLGTFTTLWGEVVTSSGNYSGFFPDSLVNGCDTIYSQSITLNNPSSSTIDIALCPVETASVCGQTYDTEGNYSLLCTNSVGCDSSVLLTVRLTQTLAQILGVSDTLRCIRLPYPLTAPVHTSVTNNYWTDTQGNTLGQGPTYQVSQIGTYIYHSTVQGTSGSCTFTDTVFIESINPITNLTIEETPDCSNQSIILNAEASPAGLSVVYHWRLPNGNLATGNEVVASQNGQYQVTAIDPQSGCSQMVSYSYFGNSLPIQVWVPGRAYLDVDNNCILSVVDMPLGNHGLNILRDGFFSDFTSTQSDGRFEMPVAPGFHYQLDAVQYASTCANGIYFDSCIVHPDTFIVLVRPDQPCNTPSVYVSNFFARPCQPATVFIRVVNNTTSSFQNQTLNVNLPPEMSFSNSSLSPTSNNGSGQLQFLMPDLPPGGAFALNLFGQVLCNTQMGDFICVKAELAPTLSCPTVSNWPQIKVDGACQGGNVEFTLTNIGSAHMTQTEYYRWIAQNATTGQTINTGTNSFQLNQNASSVISLPANGSHYTLIARQPISFPFSDEVGFRVESCTSGGQSTMLTALNYNETFSSDESCEQVVNSYDPNEKHGYPAGIGSEGYISEGSPLKYRILFQNTGSAPAIDVLISDTLSSELVASSFSLTNTSHPCEVRMDRNVVNFIFDNIWLPDSLHDEPNSHGFVEFFIRQNPNNAVGQRIENSAAIYFDNNLPVITNATLHTNGIPFLSAVTYTASNQFAEIAPTPFSTEVQISFTGKHARYHLEVFDAFGKLIESQQFNGNALTYQGGHLPSGNYLVRITDAQTKEPGAIGRLVKI